MSADWSKLDPGWSHGVDEFGPYLEGALSTETRARFHYQSSDGFGMNRFGLHALKQLRKCNASVSALSIRVLQLEDQLPELHEKARTADRLQKAAAELVAELRAEGQRCRTEYVDADSQAIGTGYLNAADLVAEKLGVES